ncbi:MAG: protein kinase domain-containing protein, partial [Frankiaceae bacterium]
MGNARDGGYVELFPDLTDLAALHSEPGRQLYRAYHLGLDRPVGVEALSTPLADNESLQRFEQTCARVHGLTGDPHIVPVHAWGLTQGGRPYVVTDLLEGGSLADRVRETGPLPVADALRIGVVVAGALAVAHEHHAVHGDVRLSHLLVAPSGEPVLGGFGLSALAADPASGAPLPAHAAPEIVEGRSGQAASDLYSLGSTLLALLTGCGPEAALVECLNRADEPAGRPALPLGADGRPLPEGVVGML